MSLNSGDNGHSAVMTTVMGRLSRVQAVNNGAAVTAGATWAHRSRVGRAWRTCDGPPGVSHITKYTRRLHRPTTRRRTPSVGRTVPHPPRRLSNRSAQAVAPS